MSTSCVALYLVLLEEGLFLSLGWLTMRTFSKPQWVFPLHPPQPWGSRNSHDNAWLVLWVAGTELRSSWLNSKRAVNYWDVSSPPLQFFRRGLMQPKLVSHSFCSWGWPWISVVPASTSWVLGLQESTTCGLCGVGDWTQALVHAGQALDLLSYPQPLLFSFLSKQDHTLKQREKNDNTATNIGVTRPVFIFRKHSVSYIIVLYFPKCDVRWLYILSVKTSQ